MEKEFPLHPLALFFAVLAGLMMLVLPRRWALVPFMFAIVFIPLQQRIIIASLDFFILRILVIFGWLRTFLRSEYHGLKFNTMDRVMILWSASSVLVYTLQWQTTGAFINRMGIAFDILGTYFLVRFLIKDFDDMVWAFKTFAVICIPVAGTMVIESATGRNYLSVLGGVPEMAVVRDGKIRCQGAFSHAITAGSFGASLYPIFMSLRWIKGRGRTIMLIGAASAGLVVLTTSSSGPAISFIAALVGVYLWKFKKNMRALRWGIFITLAVLHITMKAPVWGLIMKVKVFGASTAWHRYHLIDQWVNHFRDWWILGTKSTAKWGYYLFDVTNHFIRIAVDGGLITLVLFITVLSYAFQSVGRGVQAFSGNRAMEKFIWALGVSLFVHTVSFMGVSYFDQIKAVLYMLLAMIGTVRSLTEESYSLSVAREGLALQHR